MDLINVKMISDFLPLRGLDNLLTQQSSHPSGGGNKEINVCGPTP